VYGPQGHDKKIAFLNELREIRAACAGPWLFGGDFNLIFRDEDKNNLNINRDMMGRFRRCINDLSIKDIDLLGRKYTWSGANNVQVRLDRVFCSSDWEEKFPNYLLQSSASEDSDHCPLLLGLKDNHMGKQRFHFESFWPRFDGFLEAVTNAWGSVQQSSCPLKTLSLKFKATTKGLQSWSDRKVGNFKLQLELVREILLQLEVAKESRILNVLETWLLGRLKKCSLALASLIRSMARTRSRIAWLKDGDANTKLFYSWSRYRKRKNFIAKIHDGEQLVTSHSDKAEVLRSFYSDLIGTGQQRSRTVNLDTLGLQHIDLRGLEQPFSEEEVWNTIKQLPPDKAPGPDGFTGRFYKACWSIIKKDIMAAILTVWNKDFRNFRYLNTAFITLLPKKEDAILAKDFRPISLIHSFAKLITKVMANRLSGYMDKLISKNQSAFIKGRFIQDNFMLVQQTARLLHAQKQPRILLKLDISKAFDSVSWSFLLEVLEKVGFGPIWRDVISGLLMTSSTQIMLNGVPGEYIQHKRGLW
jgi:hypothetical protein